MRVLKYTCELNKLLIIACITAIFIMGFGKLINLGPVIGTYALLWLIKENCSLEQFYEWANIGFLIGLLIYHRLFQFVPIVFQVYAAQIVYVLL